MSVHCDFCGAVSIKTPEGIKFITGRNGVCICTKCVTDCMCLKDELERGVYKPNDEPLRVLP